MNLKEKTVRSQDTLLKQLYSQKFCIAWSLIGCVAILHEKCEITVIVLCNIMVLWLALFSTRNGKWPHCLHNLMHTLKI